MNRKTFVAFAASFVLGGLVVLSLQEEKALADKLFGGVVTTTSARIQSGSFNVVSPTSIEFVINGTGDFSDGGAALGVPFSSVTCTTSGANLVAAWNAAPATCVPLWRAKNGL